MKIDKSLDFRILPNLDAKGAKRSVKMWTTKFSDFFQKYLGVHELRAVKNSYVMSRMFYFERYCTLKYTGVFQFNYLFAEQRIFIVASFFSILVFVRLSRTTLQKHMFLLIIHEEKST